MDCREQLHTNKLDHLEEKMDKIHGEAYSLAKLNQEWKTWIDHLNQQVLKALSKEEPGPNEFLCKLCQISRDGWKPGNPKTSEQVEAFPNSFPETRTTPMPDLDKNNAWKLWVMLVVNIDEKSLSKHLPTEASALFKKKLALRPSGPCKGGSACSSQSVR